MTDEIRHDRYMANCIIDELNHNGYLQIFAGDGYGVREVNSLLSDDQLRMISNKIVSMLEDLLDDTEE